MEAKTSKKRKTRAANKNKRISKAAQLLHGDVLEWLATLPKKRFSLIVSSPPYNIGKIYERGEELSLEDYVYWQTKVARRLVECLKDDGSICWQVGNYIKDGEVFPLDIYFFEIFTRLGMRLRNRIIWRFNFGHHADRRFSGRYETLLWFTKSDEYKFNLDAVRVPQLYPGKRHAKSKAGKAGLPSGNPNGKNPSDFWEFSADKDFEQNPVWDIPNVKANHPEKTEHPCQFPIELAERCILAFTRKGDAILDPFVGTGASVIAAIKHHRKAIGIDKESRFLGIAKKRLRLLERGELSMRPLGKPVRRPLPTEKVAQVPVEWKKVRGRAPRRKKGRAK
jgi:adenine-specific DNA-methyltransferase